MRCSDWEADELSDRQVRYAAVDAHAAIKVFEALLKQLDGKHWFWRWWSKPNIWEDVAKLCAMYANQRFKAKQGVGGSKQE